MLDARQDRSYCRRVTPRPVGNDALWCTVCPADRTFEESLRRSGVTPLAEVDVQDLAMLVDRPIAVGPSAIEAAIRFIYVPLPAYWHSARAGSLCKKRQEPLNPAVNRAPINHNATLGKPFSNIRVT